MKFRSHLILCLAMAGFALLGGIAWGVLTSASSLEQKAQQIKIGMSIEEVEKIMGGPVHYSKDDNWEPRQGIEYANWKDEIGIVVVGFKDGGVVDWEGGPCVGYIRRCFDARESFWSRIRRRLGL